MESIYRQLQRKFNTMGLGLPATDAGHELKYLAELYTEEEADFALKMELGLQTPEQVAESMGIPVEEAAEKLANMAKRNNIFRVHEGDTVKYALFPVIHGFLEFNVDRFNPTIARYFSKHYMEGMGARFFGSAEPLFRVLPLRNEMVEDGKCLPIDNWETILRRQEKIAVTECFCRTSANTNPKATGCQHNPDYSELCLALGIFADFYVENGNARYITLDEAIEHMKRCDANGTVVEVLNTQDVEVMCSCCGCCCGVMKALIMFGGQSAGLVSNYTIEYDDDKCIGCGICAERCSINVIKMDNGKPITDFQKCIGCGLCVTTCPTVARRLVRKPDEEIYTPPEKTVLGLYDHVRTLRRKTGEI